jgi:hypothetical protein
MSKVIKIKTAEEYEKEILTLQQRLQQLKDETFGLRYGRFVGPREPGVSLNGLGHTEDTEHGVRIADEAFNEFVLKMSAVLARHAHKDDKPITQTQIMHKLHEEVAELVIMLKDHNTSGPCTVEECRHGKEQMLSQCADIANVAFLIYVLIKHVG